VRKRCRAEEVYVKASRRDDTALALAEEADRVRAVCGTRDIIVALDRTGRPLASEALADHLGTWLLESPPALVFVLGSASGLDPAWLPTAHVRWSFGPLTLPHDLARVVLWEQLYRAFTIREGGPYHK